MTAGFAGKILRLNLTNRSVSTIDTEKYEEWYAGNGMGSAVFWDLCPDKAIDGFDPKNVITIMTSPLSGTQAPGIAGRCQMQGVGVQGYPIGWFTRSNFGGRFCGMLKSAGWDGIVIEGAADKPVWVNVINDQVTIEDAGWLWGMDTWQTQQEIWKAVTGDAKLGEWVPVNGTSTTQRPAVLCIGPAGEHLCRSAALIHEAGHGASQGGFGGVWGAKNLKAISVQGTGHFSIADPKALLDARLWFERNFPHHRGMPAPPGPPRVPAGCQGCPKLCSTRSSKYGNGSSCIEAMWYGGSFDNPGLVDINDTNQAGDMAQRYGINISELVTYMTEFVMGGYLLKLHNMGVLGPGKAIDSAPLPWDKLWKLEFAEELMKAISYRRGIGNDLAEGAARAAKKWGRFEEDLASGILALPQWGYVWHWSLPGVEWIFGSIMDSRDVCDHEMETDGPLGLNLYLDEMSAEQHVEMIASKLIPYEGDPMMLDYTWQGADGSNMAQALETGVYSRHKAKFIAWHRHYTRFWKESIGCCDWMYANFISPRKPDHTGFTPEAETRFLNAVVGKNLSFADSIEIGRRIWNLDRAIWILQGRHREMEKPAEFLFRPGAATPKQMPVYTGGKWTFDEPLDGMFLDRKGVETFKDRYYEFEGWDTATGWPSRGTLEDLNLKHVADELEKSGKLGASGTYTGK
jgi:aldehyde:ferredoxin oxidoreductase